MSTNEHNEHHTIPRFLAKAFPEIKKLSDRSTVRVNSRRHAYYNVLFVDCSPCEVVDQVYTWASSRHFHIAWAEHQRDKKTQAFTRLFGFAPDRLHSNGNVDTVVRMLEAEFLPDKDTWETAIKQLRRAGIDKLKLWWV